MDGNGRWAKKRLLPRNLGHREGVKAIDRVADDVFGRGIKYLSLFAFSTENWNRPEDEVDGLLDLFKKYIRKNLPKLEKRGIALRISGDTSVFDDSIKSLIDEAYARTSGLETGTLNICFNYGGRADIIQAVNRFVDRGERATLETFSSELWTSDLPDPDIVIRTGGEHRISNFLLYQMAYAEVYFIDTLWPDFTAEELDGILADFERTDRRYGRIK